MSTTVTNTAIDPQLDLTFDPDRRTTSTRWPLFGVLAGIAGTATTMLMAGVSDTAKAAGFEAVFDELGQNRVQVQVGASLGFLTAALLVVFGIGLSRHLAHRLPATSAIPLAVLVALGGAVGSLTIAFSLKAMLAGGMPGGVDKALYTHTDVSVLHLFVDQLQWACFVPVAFLLPIAAYSAFRYRAISRWLGTVSAIFSVFFIGMTLIPALPYSAGVVAGPWLIIAGLGLVRSARRSA